MSKPRKKGKKNSKKKFVKIKLNDTDNISKEDIPYTPWWDIPDHLIYHHKVIEEAIKKKSSPKTLDYLYQQMILADYKHSKETGSDPILLDLTESVINGQTTFSKLFHEVLIYREELRSNY